MIKSIFLEDDVKDTAIDKSTPPVYDTTPNLNKFTIDQIMGIVDIMQSVLYDHYNLLQDNDVITISNLSEDAIRKYIHGDSDNFIVGLFNDSNTEHVATLSKDEIFRSIDNYFGRCTRQIKSNLNIDIQILIETYGDNKPNDSIYYICIRKLQSDTVLQEK